MSTVNLEISTVARIIHLLTKRQSHAETNMAHDLARAIELAATTESEPKTIAVSTPDCKSDERLMKVFSRRTDRICFNPKYWLTPGASDAADALNMALTGIDWANKPNTRDLLEEIVTALGVPNFVWRNANDRTLTATIIRNITSNVDGLKEKNKLLVERFNLLETLRAQLSVQNWDQMAGALADLKKQRDSHSDSAEILDFIVKTLKVLPGTDIVKRVEELVKNSNKEYGGLIDELRDMLGLDAGDSLKEAIVDVTTKYSEVAAANIDLRRDLKMYQESAAYRGQCLDQISELLGVEPSMSTPAQIVAEVGLLKRQATVKAVDEALRAATPINHEHNAETTLANIRSIMYDRSLGGEVQRQRVMELLK